MPSRPTGLIATAMPYFGMPRRAWSVESWRKTWCRKRSWRRFASERRSTARAAWAPGSWLSCDTRSRTIIGGRAARREVLDEVPSNPERPFNAKGKWSTVPVELARTDPDQLAERAEFWAVFHDCLGPAAAALGPGLPIARDRRALGRGRQPVGRRHFQESGSSPPQGSAIATTVPRAQVVWLSTRKVAMKRRSDVPWLLLSCCEASRLASEELDRALTRRERRRTSHPSLALRWMPAIGRALADDAICAVATMPDQWHQPSLQVVTLSRGPPSHNQTTPGGCSPARLQWLMTRLVHCRKPAAESR